MDEAGVRKKLKPDRDEQDQQQGRQDTPRQQFTLLSFISSFVRWK